MKIDMNKNFEEEFRVTFWKGLTARELATGILALLASIGTAVFLWYFTGIPVNICVYAGLPAMLLIGWAGIYQYQGMTVFQLLKEARYMGKTKELASEAGEYRETAAVFTMRGSADRAGRRRRRGKGM